MKSLLFFFFLPFLTFAQLPTQSVIREKGITKLEVWRHDLPPITQRVIGSNDSTIFSEEVTTDTVITLSKTWFFDALGRPTRSEFQFEGEQFIGEFAYDENNRINHRIYSSNGVETFSETVNQRPDSLFEFKRWQDGKLVDHYLTYPDSTIHYSFPLKKGHLPYYIFDRKQQYTQVAEYRKGKLLSLRKETWVRNSEGQVYLLEIDFQQHKRATKRNGREKSYHEIFPVALDGEIEATQGHRRPRPYFSENGRKSSLISTYDLQEFNSDELLERTDDKIILSFDRDDQYYFYSFDFYYATDQY